MRTPSRPDRIGAFKRRCLEAALKVQDRRPGYGILCDGRLAADALSAAEGRGHWIGRPVEWPGSRPRYVGFSLWQLRVGETVSEATGDCEVILVMVEGKAPISGAGQDWSVLGERVNVFERTPPHCLYLPNGAEWKAVAEADCVIAVCSAPGKGGHDARRIGPEGITLTQRGKGSNGYDAL